MLHTSGLDALDCFDNVSDDFGDNTIPAIES